MAIVNLGTITSIQQKINGSTFEKTIHIRLDLNKKMDESEEINIYVCVDTNHVNKNKKEEKKAMLIPMDWDIKVTNDFELSLNKKYDFVLADINNEHKIHVIGLTEYSEK